MAIPTVDDKVILVDFSLAETSAFALQEVDTQKQFSATDRGTAFIGLKADGIENGMTVDISLANLDDDSRINRTFTVTTDDNFDAVNMIFYYQLADDEIVHWGNWIGYGKFTDGVTVKTWTGKKFKFSISRDITNDPETRLIIMDDVNSFMASMAIIKSDLEADHATAQADHLNYSGLLEDGVLTTQIIAKLTELETTYAPEMVSLREQLEHIAKKNFLRQPKPMFGHSGLRLIEPPTTDAQRINGDPDIVWDAENACWRMFYFQFTLSAEKGIFDAWSTDLKHWTKRNIKLTTDTLVKLTVLKDSVGNPVKIDGKYHGYALTLDKVMYHLETTNLGNTSWTNTGIVIDKGFAANGTDVHGADAPCAIYDELNQKVILYYMAFPSVAQSDFGLASRINRAVSDTPNGGFMYDGVAVLPSSTSSEWYYGWIGGMQILKTENGYFVAVNASPSRPGSVGNETEPSMFGFGTMTDLYATAKLNAQPCLKPQADFVGTTNYEDGSSVWRPFLVYDIRADRYVVFYNTGSNGVEFITCAYEGTLKFVKTGVNISVPTVDVENEIPNTHFTLPIGHYKITATPNLFAGQSPTPIDATLYLYATDNETQGITTFMGHYAWDNRNIIFNGILDIINPNSVIHFRIKLANGTPNDFKVRDFSFMIECV